MLSRLALRLAAVEALAPTAALTTGLWPTVAAGRVFDSRQTPLDGLVDEEARPLIVVYTEGAEARPFGDGKTRPDHIVCDLVVELMLIVKGAVELQRPDGTVVTEGAVGTPIMERQHEALLDLLEAQVTRRLRGEVDVDTDTLRFRAVAKEIGAITSVPQRDETRTERLAARTLVFSCRIPADAWPAQGALAGVARLPEPLASVYAGLPAGSSARAAAGLVAGLLADVAPKIPLLGIDLDAALERAAGADPDVSFSADFPAINLDFSLPANSSHFVTVL